MKHLLIKPWFHLGTDSLGEHEVKIQSRKPSWHFLSGFQEVKAEEREVRAS